MKERKNNHLNSASDSDYSAASNLNTPDTPPTPPERNKQILASKNVGKLSRDDENDVFQSFDHNDSDEFSKRNFMKSHNDGQIFGNSRCSSSLFGPTNECAVSSTSDAKHMMTLNSGNSTITPKSFVQNSSKLISPLKLNTMGSAGDNDGGSVQLDPEFVTARSTTSNSIPTTTANCRNARNSPSVGAKPKYHGKRFLEFKGSPDNLLNTTVDSDYSTGHEYESLSHVVTFRTERRPVALNGSTNTPNFKQTIPQNTYDTWSSARREGNKYVNISSLHSPASSRSASPTKSILKKSLDSNSSGYDTLQTGYRTGSPPKNSRYSGLTEAKRKLSQRQLKLEIQQNKNPPVERLCQSQKKQETQKEENKAKQIEEENNAKNSQRQPVLAGGLTAEPTKSVIVKVPLIGSGRNDIMDLVEIMLANKDALLTTPKDDYNPPASLLTNGRRPRSPLTKPMHQGKDVKKKGPTGGNAGKGVGNSKTGANTASAAPYSTANSVPMKENLAQSCGQIGPESSPIAANTALKSSESSGRTRTPSSSEITYWTDIATTPSKAKSTVENRYTSAALQLRDSSNRRTSRESTIERTHLDLKSDDNSNNRGSKNRLAASIEKLTSKRRSATKSPALKNSAAQNGSSEENKFSETVKFPGQTRCSAKEPSVPKITAAPKGDTRKKKDLEAAKFPGHISRMLRLGGRQGVNNILAPTLTATPRFLKPGPNGSALNVAVKASSEDISSVQPDASSTSLSKYQNHKTTLANSSVPSHKEARISKTSSPNNSRSRLTIFTNNQNFNSALKDSFLKSQSDRDIAKSVSEAGGLSSDQGLINEPGTGCTEGAYETPRQRGSSLTPELIISSHKIANIDKDDKIYTNSSTLVGKLTNDSNVTKLSAKSRDLLIASSPVLNQRESSAAKNSVRKSILNHISQENLSNKSKHQNSKHLNSTNKGSLQQQLEDDVTSHPHPSHIRSKSIVNVALSTFARSSARNIPSRTHTAGHGLPREFVASCDRGPFKRSAGYSATASQSAVCLAKAAPHDRNPEARKKPRPHHSQQYYIWTRSIPRLATPPHIIAQTLDSETPDDAKSFAESDFEDHLCVDYGDERNALRPGRGTSNAETSCSDLDGLLSKSNSVIFESMKNIYRRVADCQCNWCIAPEALKSMDVSTTLDRAVSAKRRKRLAEENRAMAQSPQYPIEVGRFAQYYQSRKRKPSILKGEFLALQHVIVDNPTEFGSKAQNASKNMAADVLPYDYNRVVLKTKPGIPDSHYINASYVDSFYRPKAYIVTQACRTKSSCGELWRMVWEQKSNCVVMLTKLFDFMRVMSLQYFPDSDCAVYGDIYVIHLKTLTYASFTVRYYQISKYGEKSNFRYVAHFHFTDWELSGFPCVKAFIDFRRRVRDHMARDPSNGPLVVHGGSGGVRSGIFLAVDANMELMAEENLVDVFGYAKIMINGRRALVHDLSSYSYIYDVLLECVLCAVEPFPATELQSRVLSYAKAQSNLDGDNVYTAEYKLLNAMSPVIRVGDCAGGHRLENRVKNRDVMIVPPDYARPYLSTVHGDSKDYTYINAVYCDGYTRKQEWIVTEWPKHSTIESFWALVYDHHCKSAVVLTCQENNKIYPKFLDTSGKQHYGPFLVQVLKFNTYPYMTSYLVKIFKQKAPKFNTLVQQGMNAMLKKQTFMLSELMEPEEALYLEEECVMCHIFMTRNWPLQNALPTSTTGLIDLIEHCRSWHTRQMANTNPKDPQSPTILMSQNGVSRCGVYVAINSVIDSIEMDGEVDVYHAVKALRTNRPQLVDSKDEYKYIYDALLHYCLMKPHHRDLLRTAVEQTGKLDRRRGSDTELVFEYNI